MNHLSPKEKQDILEDLVLDPAKWKQKADDLLHAASFLKPEVELIYRKLGPKRLDPHDDCNRELHPSCTADVYFMLLGYAIENILKGILVGQGKHTLTGAQKLPEGWFKHDVLSLAKSAGFDLDSLEEDILRRMKEIIVWRARYNTPNACDDLFKEFHRRNNDLRVLEKLLDKISRK